MKEKFKKIYIVTIVTQVEVDTKDSALNNPSKLSLQVTSDIPN